MIVIEKGRFKLKYTYYSKVAWKSITQIKDDLIQAQQLYGWIYLMFNSNRKPRKER